ncbi:MAG: succinate dehydrogenase, cytochrome b556 subunit [Legionella sp.]
MNDKRPVNLDLGSLKYPVTAIVSILHRISGLVLFLSFPFVLYALSLSLHSQEAFIALQLQLLQPFYRLLVWLFAAALIYHLIAGVRHILMDLGFSESLQAGRQSAFVVIVLTAVLTLVAGVFIW